MKKRHLLFASLFITMGLITWSSCTFDTTPRTVDCDNLSDISFAEDVLSIVQTNCATAGCHNAASAKSGYVFEDYSGTKNAVDNGRLIGVINHESGFSNMPPSFQLDVCDRGIIETWVNEGALDN